MPCESSSRLLSGAAARAAVALAGGAVRGRKPRPLSATRYRVHRIRGEAYLRALSVLHRSRGARSGIRANSPPAQGIARSRISVCLVGGDESRRAHRWPVGGPARGRLVRARVGGAEASTPTDLSAHRSRIVRELGRGPTGVRGRHEPAAAGVAGYGLLGAALIAEGARPRTLRARTRGLSTR